MFQDRPFWHLPEDEDDHKVEVPYQVAFDDLGEGGRGGANSSLEQGRQEEDEGEREQEAS